MALQNIPVLSSDYPLFDWADYQSCRNALIPDGQTAEFKKETWNAIIDTLADALAAAGIVWDSKYTTADGAKITKEYGDLTASAFNSIRYNIDKPLPIGWAWAWNPDFRGYIGREDFRGCDEYGESGDYVYAEYIIELVRKLNLLIEVMRGTKDRSMSFPGEEIPTDYAAELNTGHSDHMASELKSATMNSVELLARFIAYNASEIVSKTVSQVQGVSLPSLQIPRGENQSVSDSTGISIPVPSLRISKGTGIAHSVSSAEKVILKESHALAGSIHAVKSQHSSKLVCWMPPVFVGEGALMIRQAYEANQDGTTLEVV